MPKQRLEAFSDGVFAIVITLLILDVRIPPTGGGSFGALLLILPQLAAFVLSFVIVGVYWVAHHMMLHFVRAVDRPLLWANLLLLLTVVLIPVPTAWLGQHLASPAAITAYGASLSCTNAAGCLVWRLGTRRHGAEAGRLEGYVRFVTWVHAAPILVYAAGAALAFAAPYASLLLYAAVPTFFILPNRVLDTRLRAAMAADAAPAHGP